MNRWIPGVVLLIAVSEQARIVEVGVNSGVILAGKDVRFSVTVDTPAPPAGQTIAVSCDPARVYAPPAAVQIAPKATSGWVTLRPRPVLTATPLLVTFTVEDSTKSIEVNVQPAEFFRLLTDYTAISGTAVRLSTMFAGIPAAGETIALKSDDPVTFPVPATVPAGGEDLRLPTVRLTEEKFVTITATYQGTTKAAGVLLRPLTLAEITGPADAVSGSKIQLNINLTQPAVFGDEVVKLTSSSPAVVKVPSTLAIPANSATKAVEMVAGRVREPKSVTITAALGSVKKTFKLDVKPKP